MFLKTKSVVKSSLSRRSPRNPFLFKSIPTAIALLAATLPAHADQRDFPFTYSWFQATKGEKELAYHLRYRRRDNSWEHQLEFEYGVSDRFSIAPYIVFEHGEGRSLHYDAVKLETRYQLGNYRTNTILPGLYLEFEQPNREPGELEAKLILSLFDRRGGNLSFNYIVEREFASGADFEHTYSLAYARQIGRRGARLGGEWIHELTSGRLLFGPTLFMRMSAASSFTAGYAFPLNGKEGNRAEFRLFMQYHWF